MKIGVIYDARRTERFLAVCEALRGLGHKIITINSAENSFLSGLVSSKVEAVFDTTTDNGGNRTLTQLLKILRIPLLRDKDCCRYLGCLLNMRSTEAASAEMRGYR
ncbi:MAG: hypothetical protein LBJ96_00130 [Holosporaceae bacterium]|nr:hypothetical protein [Holosporaceae bacterium]